MKKTTARTARTPGTITKRSEPMMCRFQAAGAADPSDLLSRKPSPFTPYLEGHFASKLITRLIIDRRFARFFGFAFPSMIISSKVNRAGFAARACA